MAFVPSADGQAGNGGDLPTATFPGGYNPAFSDVSLASIQNDAVDPLPAFDTVVLAQVCDIGTYLANAQFKSRLEGFVNNGGKLLIWDSECDATDYSLFYHPFTTSNPGAAGANGTLTITENNALANTNPASPQFVDVNLISTDTDAVGDANVFVTKDVDWCVALSGQNTLGVNGPVLNYARGGAGLIIYSGLDYDVLSPTMSFDPASTSGADHLARLWLNELQTDGSNLPCGVVAYGLTLTPPTASLPQGTTHTLTATMFNNGVPVPGVTVTFTVTGANAGTTGSVVTDANGQAVFTYTGTNAGDDTVTAEAAIAGAPSATRTAAVTWVAPETTTTTTTTTTTVLTQPVQFVTATPTYSG